MKDEKEREKRERDRASDKKKSFGIINKEVNSLFFSFSRTSINVEEKSFSMLIEEEIIRWNRDIYSHHWICVEHQSSSKEELAETFVLLT